jgi:hypothetical protein
LVGESSVFEGVVMNRVRILTVVMAVGSLSLLSGCLTLYSKVEVIREDEPRRPITFENPQAADVF